MGCLRVYEPINELKTVDADIWVVDGPEVRMRYFGLRLPFTTRMTVVRLPDGRLWVHSPTERAAGLDEALGALGEVGFLISPNRLHTTWLATWKDRWPGAATAGVAAERTWSGAAIEYGIDLGGAKAFPWDATIETMLVPGGMFSEAVFFHKLSRTLILTDLIENFERHRVTCAWLRLLLRITGPLDPEGSAPPDMRYTFRRYHEELRAAVRQMCEWGPRRVIFSHGRWYESDAIRELERAFAWVF